jgi:hypothetical protein
MFKNLKSAAIGGFIFLNLNLIFFWPLKTNLKTLIADSHLLAAVKAPEY